MGQKTKAMAYRPSLHLIRPVQLVLATLSALTAGAILGTAAHAFSVYATGRAANNPWWLPLWPQHFYTANAEAVIGASAGIVLLNVAYIVLSLVPKINMSSRPVLGALTTIGLAVPSLLLALFSIVFNSIMNEHTTNADTLRTWTCRFDKSMPIVGISIPEKLSNGQFGLLCTELKFGEYGMIGVLALEFLLAVSAIGQWLKRGLKGASKDSSSDINMDTSSPLKI